MQKQKSYFEALSAIISQTEIATKGTASYLSAASALRLAGRPVFNFVDFVGNVDAEKPVIPPHLSCLNGALVAVDIALTEGGKAQRMWLPVMDEDDRALVADQITVRDINNS